MLTMRKLFLIAGVLGMTASAMAESKDDYLRVTSYATTLGRAQACGLDIGETSGRVEYWMDNTFFGEARDVQAKIFANTVQFSAEKQKTMKTPHSCSSVLKSYKETKWP